MVKVAKITEQQRLKALSISSVLDAALECITGDNIAKISIDDIAARAGVGRATVYRNFRNKEDIYGQLFLREFQDFKDQLLAIIDKASKPEDILINCIVFVVENFPRTSLYTMIFNEKAGLYSGRLIVSSDVIQNLATEICIPFYKAIKRSAQLRPGLTESMLTDWLSRIVVSLITMPSQFQRSTKDLKKYIELLIIPSIMQSQA